MTVKAWKYMVKKIADKGKPMFFKKFEKKRRKFETAMVHKNKT